MKYLFLFLIPCFLFSQVQVSTSIFKTDKKYTSGGVDLVIRQYKSSKRFADSIEFQFKSDKVVIVPDTNFIKFIANCQIEMEYLTDNKIEFNYEINNVLFAFSCTNNQCLFIVKYKYDFFATFDKKKIRKFIYSF